MYVARFSYAVMPADRQRAIALINREVEAAHRNRFRARLLVPLTRRQGGAALQFEVEFPKLDDFEQFRARGLGSDDDTGAWMREFSMILASPPEVELLRAEESSA